MISKQETQNKLKNENFGWCSLNTVQLSELLAAAKLPGDNCESSSLTFLLAIKWQSNESDDRSAG